MPDGDKLCADAKCEFHSECEVINGSAKCKCKKGCTREYNPKCGSDNITYGNPCELRRASCEEMREIEIVSDGECGELKTSYQCGGIMFTMRNCVIVLQHCRVQRENLFS